MTATHSHSENLITTIWTKAISVFIASDHGHVEATGFGQPSEGLLAQTRGKRARLYQDRLAAVQVQTHFQIPFYGSTMDSCQVR